MRNALYVLVAILVLGLVPAVSAQTVVNPTTVEFTASPDHDATIDGVAIVARYELRYMQVGGVAVGTVDLGKPAPVNGQVVLPITLDMLPFSPSARYIAYVAAIGPTGEGVSAASNPFAQVGPPASPGTPIVKK